MSFPSPPTSKVELHSPTSKRVTERMEKGDSRIRGEKRSITSPSWGRFPRSYLYCETEKKTTEGLLTAVLEGKISVNERREKTERKERGQGGPVLA